MTMSGSKMEHRWEARRLESLEAETKKYANFTFERPGIPAS